MCPCVPKYTHMCVYTWLQKPEAWIFAVENLMTGCSGPGLPYHLGQSAFLSVSHDTIYPSLRLQILSAKYQGRKNTHVSHQFTSSLYLGWNQEATSPWPHPDLSFVCFGGDRSFLSTIPVRLAFYYLLPFFP